MLLEAKTVSELYAWVHNCNGDTLLYIKRKWEKELQAA